MKPEPVSCPVARTARKLQTLSPSPKSPVADSPVVGVCNLSPRIRFNRSRRHSLLQPLVAANRCSFLQPPVAANCHSFKLRSLKNILRIYAKKVNSCAWEQVHVPSSVRSIVALNLPSYGSGRNPWGNLKPEYLEKPPCCSSSGGSCGLSSVCEDCTTCFRRSELQNGRPSTTQFREKLTWFLSALPSADCAKGGNGAYTSHVELEGRQGITIKASTE